MAEIETTEQAADDAERTAAAPNHPLAIEPVEQIAQETSETEQV
jgi:hypothetical protein